MAEETLNGAGTNHSTHGIIIREPCSNPVDSAVTVSNSNKTQTSNDVPILKSKKRSATYVQRQIEVCFDISRTEPTRDVTTTQ
ncbi:hypothetical protein ElyMa_000485100 [Elysia marginata]|uniref:Uncharacterized protein n=1 Tax=Elysia marginata TaxID=1093978 RepID=A0AAV4FT88_9GAST|nr:hypothetical protein ElyMa_000485100 [Elysia marginata]